VAMAQPYLVLFKGQKDWYKVIAICHGINLHLFEVQREFDSSCSINVNQHELINKVVMKISKVSKSGCNFREVSNSYRSIDAQTIGFNKCFLFLEPCKKIAIRASELDVSKGTIAEHMASNADMHLVLFFNASGWHFEKLLEFVFACRNQCRCEVNLFVIGGISKD